LTTKRREKETGKPAVKREKKAAQRAAWVKGKDRLEKPACCVLDL